MILEVQIQIFGGRASARHALARTQQSLHFQKIPGGLNINIFPENRQEKQIRNFKFKKIPF